MIAFLTGALVLLIGIGVGLYISKKS